LNPLTLKCFSDAGKPIPPKKNFLKPYARLPKGHEALALGEYEKYRIIRDRLMESDFDREVQKLLKTSKKK
jgi:hypothetical protein